MRKNNLKIRQNYDLILKTLWAKQRIYEFYVKMYGRIYVSFSGGKDSTVLLHLVRSMYPEVPAVFVDTGLEYPEIRDFVKTVDNVIWLKPKMNFRKVLEVYGYPIISKIQAKYIREVQNGTTEYTRNKRLYGKNGTSVGMISKKWQFLINSEIKVSEKCCDVMKKRPLNIYEKKLGYHLL